jgi:hypothetical protein
VTEDFAKYAEFSLLPYNRYGYEYGLYYPYNRDPPYEIDQFDVGAFNDGRYAAAIFNGETIPIDSTGWNSNFFRDFSSFAYILFGGNVSYPGFFGQGSVMATPTNAVKISVPADIKTTDPAKKFMEWLFTGSESALSISALKAAADYAVDTPRTHERNGITVRDTAYFSAKDYYVFPDVTRAEADRLLDEIINHSFAAPDSLNTMENYYHYDTWLGRPSSSTRIDLYYSGEYSLEDLCKEMETNAADNMAHAKERDYFLAED